MTALPSSSIRISVSVGRKVLPRSVNSRRGTSSRMSGLPIQRRWGRETKNAISAYPTMRRRFHHVPSDTRGRIQNRDPSSFSVGSTRPAAFGAVTEA